MRRKITYTCITLFITTLTMGRFCSAGQKVAITGMNDDPRITFAVRDIKQALQKSGYELVNKDSELRIVTALFEPGMGGLCTYCHQPV